MERPAEGLARLPCFTKWHYALYKRRKKQGSNLSTRRGSRRLFFDSFWGSAGEGFALDAQIASDFKSNAVGKKFLRFCLVSRAAKRGVSRSGLVLPFLSFFVLFGTFPTFPGFSRFVRGWSGDFPICPFPLSRPINSTYEEQSRKGPRLPIA